VLKEEEAEPFRVCLIGVATAMLIRQALVHDRLDVWGDEEGHG